MEPYEIIAGPLVDEALLQRGLGLTQVAAREAASAYLRIPLGHRPNLCPWLDNRFYLERFPDIAAAGVDPLLHFAENGIAEQRMPHPLVDIGFIVAQRPGLPAQSDPAAALAGLLGADAVRPSAYFDAAHYAAQCAAHGIAPAGGLLRHCLVEGLAAGLTPNAYLDPAAYARLHPDVPLDPLRALAHFVLHGDLEGRAAGESFDGRTYLALHPDVKAGSVPALYHFLTAGRQEGRTAVASASRLRQGHAGFGAVTLDAPPAPEQIAAERADYDRVMGLAAAARQARIAAFAPRQAAPFHLAGEEGLRRAIAGLRFPAPASPEISILIPVHEQPRVTAECLLSIAAAPPGVPYEVVLADDASADPRIAGMGRAPGVVWVRQEANAGFLRNCNAAFARCRGRFVLLLNNDAQLLPGALTALHRALLADPQAAAAGPKLIYPDGRLQEAGCALGADGEATMVGLFEDPARPAFSHPRRIAYASGAALLVRRDAVEGPLFDEAYAPAYCEDADLCLRLWAAGRHVLYVPEAVVVHHLSASSGKEGEARKLRMVRRNQQRLMERWQDRLAAMNRVRVLAFHLPQFHRTAENDAWWGAGFTEWTNVARALPSYVGHAQPSLPADLGFYDLSAAGAFAAQAALARRYGVAGFCVYYYSFAGRRVLDRAFEAALADPALDFPFCPCWANENWTRHWDGGDREVLLAQDYGRESLEAVAADFARYAADPRCIRVGDAPLLLVYRPLLLPDPPGFAALLRRRVTEAGLPPPHLCCVEGMEMVEAGLRPASLGFDAAVEFPPQRRAVPMEDPAVPLKEGWAGRRYDYARTAASFADRRDAGYCRYPGVFPAWDNTPRQPLAGTSFDGATPAAFQAYCELKIAEAQALLPPGEGLLFVNAWNEWAEGAMLEPDRRLGHRRLEALHAALLARGAI